MTLCKQGKWDYWDEFKRDRIAVLRMGKVPCKNHENGKRPDVIQGNEVSAGRRLHASSIAVSPKA